MQLRGPTAFEWSDKIGRPMPALGLYDWEQNVELGSAYLRFLRDRMGSWQMALAGYNWGPTKVYRGIREAGGGVLPQHMRVYEKRVNTAYARLTRAAKVDTHAPLGAI
jgi:soluble lytic murein transglycosylase-like protein